MAAVTPNFSDRHVFIGFDKQIEKDEIFFLYAAKRKNEFIVKRGSEKRESPSDYDSLIS